jgi:hypothetical protein
VFLLVIRRLIGGSLYGLLRAILHLTPLPLSLPSSLDLKPALYLTSLLPTVPKPVLALSISQAILAAWQVSLFTCEIGATLSDPVHHATAAELIPAIALRVAAGFLELDQSATFWAGLVGVVGLAPGFAVDGRKTLSVLCTGFAGVLWAIAVGADLEVAFCASEDAAVFLAVVRLDGLGSITAVHSDVALVERHLHGMAKRIDQDSHCKPLAPTSGMDMINSPVLGHFACQTNEVSLADLGCAEHAFDLAGLVLLFDLQAEMCFLALAAGSLLLAVLAFVGLGRDSESHSF